jgi:polysaccharide deacetylase family protein (PEP-CTERM system associated)
MIHALTVDLEDYRSIVARDYFGREVPPDAIVVENTERLLGWFAERDVRATFFALGDVVESYPQLIRDIASAGHELGVHGHHHRQVFKLTPESFRREVEIPKQMIEDLIGGPVRGHRAPAFSIMPKTAWALDILAELGFRYDSSIMPIHGRRYGWPGYPLDIHTHRLNDRRPLVEAPLSTVRLMGRQVPVGGGGYLRHFPLSFTRWGLRRIQRSVHSSFICILAKYRPAPILSHSNHCLGRFAAAAGDSITCKFAIAIQSKRSSRFDR